MRAGTLAFSGTVSGAQGNVVFCDGQPVQVEQYNAQAPTLATEAPVGLRWHHWVRPIRFTLVADVRRSKDRPTPASLTSHSEEWMDVSELERLVTGAFADRDRLKDPEVRRAIESTISLLDRGEIRVASKQGGEWKVLAWAKQAILLFFAIRPLEPMEAGTLEFFDKVPTKKNLKEQGIRVVPPGVARYGSFLEPGCVLMPGYVNIGAYVGAGTMVDTWATVGSCAQIGKGVHLSGGVGIGGVLEPPTASPVIIEDGAFIGSRSIVVEGVVVEEEAVLGANVVLTASTPIIDVTGEYPRTMRGRVPARSVVIPGSQPKEFSAGVYYTPCALIIGERKESTDLKTSLNDVLRTFDVQV